MAPGVGECLKRLAVLALDCQATGPLSAGGTLLEVGWAGTRAESPPAAVAEPAAVYRVRPEREAEIPAVVRRLTGLTPADFETACRPASVWRRLCRAAAGGPSAGRRPLVVHFARFEEPFLRDLHRRFDGGTFPLQIVCTHRIARRLYPELPRRGLRALAGYFGHAVPEPRRCIHHTAATIVVWRHLVPELARRAGVATLADLEEWLRRTRPGAARGPRRYPMSPDRRRALSAEPGVYRMLDAGGRALYVGKARSLKQRVNSYFQPRRRHPEHILEMLTQARGVETTCTGSALEAALLEADEIKRLSPPYNQALRRRGRRVWYASRDLLSFRPRPDAEHRIGPLPSRRLAAVPGGLAEALAGRAPPPTERWLAALGPPTEIDLLAAAVDAFRRRHGDRIGARPGVRDLSRLGRRLWCSRQTGTGGSRDPDPAAPDKPDPPRASEPETAERLADRLEAALTHAGRLLRRARWTCMLSEAILVWERPEGGPARGVVLSSGRVVRRLQIARVEDFRPMGRRPAARPAGGIDLAGCDRLRVLTTEMRRLVAEKRALRLWPRPGVFLGPLRLQRALGWF